MRPLSDDLRQRILDAVDHHEGSQRELAERFAVNPSTIARLLQLRRQTGSAAPRPHGGGKPPTLNPDALEQLRRLVQEAPDATLDQYRQRLGVQGSIMIIWRGLKRLGITRKKKSPRAAERDRPEVHLAPGLRPGDVVIFDNLAAHLGPAVAEALEGAGASVLRLPPYSPDFTPIEQLFSKLKGRLERLGARTKDRLYQAIRQALGQVTPRDILGWFQHAGLRATHV